MYIVKRNTHVWGNIGVELQISCSPSVKHSVNSARITLICYMHRKTAKFRKFDIDNNEKYFGDLVVFF